MLQLSDIEAGQSKDTRAVRNALDAAVAILDDAHRELSSQELADLGIQLEAYIEEVAARPSSCAIPPS